MTRKTKNNEVEWTIYTWRMQGQKQLNKQYIPEESNSSPLKIKQLNELYIPEEEKKHEWTIYI